MSKWTKAHSRLFEHVLLDKDPQLAETLARKELSRAEASGEVTADLEVSLAVAIMFQRRLPEARNLINSVLDRFPKRPAALWCDALLSIYMKDPWPVVSRKLEARWAIGERPFTAQANWDGSPLNGHSVLLAGEGGLGDQIQFVRFAPLLKAAGAGRVIVSVRPGLANLVQTMEGIDAVVSGGFGSNPPVDPADYDVGLPMMSAPVVLNVTEATLRAAVPYLRVPETAIDSARRRIATGRNHFLNVGICRLAGKEIRSLPLELFRPLAEIPGVRLSSLAEHSSIDEKTASFPIASLGSSDIVSDAGAISALDLVITVDTMIAHLAGSLGRPVWLLLSYLPDCRWALEGTTTPWYPTMRLFRREGHNWESVIRNIADELADMARVRGSCNIHL